ncbi:ProQ/FINO family protein [Collimonas humicola]|uniref:ProQ/FINO family protein n=1 Tax=Collimonas humicola TaxID=2825886 RepID=UPI001E3DBDCE|nr:ProQ/FinO family protein [Collimonas humicola]
MNTPVAAATPNPVQTARVLLKDLQEKYAVFRDYLPLAIGIDKQLIALSPEINRKTLRIALGMHTNSLRYLKGMEKATHRFDLEGNSTDEVTEVHRTHATETLRERFKKNAEQRKLQRAAEAAQQAAEKAAAQHAEKLSQLTAKFSRNR